MSKEDKKKEEEIKEISAAYHKAIHDEDTCTHVVELKDIHVLVLNNDGSWFAQGLGIDYSSEGESLEQVKKYFEQGLHLTIHEHLKNYGEITQLLKPAPEKYWDMYYDEVLKPAKSLKFSSTTLFVTENKKQFYSVDLKYFENTLETV